MVKSIFRDSKLLLSLKTIWFEEIGEDFQTKCKLMLDKKHSIEGMWKKIKPYVLEYCKGTDEPEYIEVIEDYCMQIHKIDSELNSMKEIKAEIEAEYRAEMEAEYYAEMMAENDYCW